MLDALQPLYPWIKAAHVIAMVAWMAGIFYLPRLFVYHVEGLRKQGVVRGSDMDLLFQHQERLLLRAIMNPAMVATWALGVLLIGLGGWWSSGWLWVKLAAVVALTGFHMWLAARRRDFVEGRNTLKGRSYRIMNEVPTLLLLVIVVMVIVKPF
ncbi:protoporphyrinogen oxidase HemJ [Rubellimicrobium aerolatum]|uniref:Protoporphyrinogen IX oxidase n=1 Tax=Rubellimicrobium aerolatum TaxID=490979 RepID=A0ABW0SA97_9RHOB|nr:protoporphyrinogen oxidase HemJ [Rubellimicrobium aerolatum]MBP1805148.1 putative membrane protein [Rubellimicrobium aerolatum]